MRCLIELGLRETKEFGWLSSLEGKQTVMASYWTIVEFRGLPPLIPLLQCVNWLGFEICSVNSCQSEQGSWLR